MSLEGFEIIRVVPDDEEAIDSLADLETTVLGERADWVEDTQDCLADGWVIEAVMDGDKMVASTFTAVEADRHDDSPTLVRLPADAVHGKGSMVDPNYRGHGLQLALLKRREEIAREHGKQRIISTVRPENAPSLHNFLAAGGVVVHYDREFFGPDPTGDTARLIVVQDLQLPEWTTVQKAVIKGYKDRDNPRKTGDSGSLPPLTLSVAPMYVDRGASGPYSPDASARGYIDLLLREADYVGVSLQRPARDQIYTDEGPRAELVLASLSTLPERIAERLQATKSEIRHILALAR